MIIRLSCMNVDPATAPNFDVQPSRSCPVCDNPRVQTSLTMERIRIIPRAARRAIPGQRCTMIAAAHPPYPSLATIRAMSSVTETGFWKGLIPKGLRKTGPYAPSPEMEAMTAARRAAGSKAVRKAKEWNPATFFIIIFLLIGSMSVHQISLNQELDRFVRQSDLRIALLRETVEKIQRGEKVDVEKALGTGDPALEAEWEQGTLPSPGCAR